MSIINHEGKILLEKTTFSRNKRTGNITLTDEEVALINDKKIFAIVVYSDKEKAKRPKAIIKEPWNYASQITKAPNKAYSLLSYNGHELPPQ